MTLYVPEIYSWFLKLSTYLCNVLIEQKKQKVEKLIIIFFIHYQGNVNRIKQLYMLKHIFFQRRHVDILCIFLPWVASIRRKECSSLIVEGQSEVSDTGIGFVWFHQNCSSAFRPSSAFRQSSAFRPGCCLLLILQGG